MAVYTVYTNFELYIFVLEFSYYIYIYTFVVLFIFFKNVSSFYITALTGFSAENAFCSIPFTVVVIRQ